jgi:hypothetical protein
VAAFAAHGITLAPKQCKPSGNGGVIVNCTAGTIFVLPDRKFPTTQATLAPDAGRGDAFDVLVLDDDASAIDPGALADTDLQAKSLTDGGRILVIYRKNSSSSATPTAPTVPTASRQRSTTSDAHPRGPRLLRRVCGSACGRHRVG